MKKQGPKQVPKGKVEHMLKAAPKKRRGNPNWVKGRSGNPAGRKPKPRLPAGATFDQRLLAEVDEQRMVKSLARSAESGDPAAVARFVQAQAAVEAARQRETEGRTCDLDRLSTPRLVVLADLIQVLDGETVADLSRHLLEATVESLGSITGVALTVATERVVRDLQRQEEPEPEPKPEPPPIATLTQTVIAEPPPVPPAPEPVKPVPISITRGLHRRSDFLTDPPTLEYD